MQQDELSLALIWRARPRLGIRFFWVLSPVGWFFLFRLLQQEPGNEAMMMIKWIKVDWTRERQRGEREREKERAPAEPDPFRSGPMNQSVNKVEFLSLDYNQTLFAWSIACGVKTKQLYTWFVFNTRNELINYLEKRRSPLKQNKKNNKIERKEIQAKKNHHHKDGSANNENALIWLEIPLLVGHIDKNSNIIWFCFFFVRIVCFRGEWLCLLCVFSSFIVHLWVVGICFCFVWSGGRDIFIHFIYLFLL